MDPLEEIDIHCMNEEISKNGCAQFVRNHEYISKIGRPNFMAKATSHRLNCRF